jgi:hypothetical protein
MRLGNPTGEGVTRGRPGRRSGATGEDAQMTAASGGTFGLGGHRRAIRTAGFTHGFGQCRQLVRGLLRMGELPFVPHDFPSLGDGEPEGMDLTKVIGVRFGRCRQRTDYRCRVAIGVSQRGDSGL